MAPTTLEGAQHVPAILEYFPRFDPVSTLHPAPCTLHPPSTSRLNMSLSKSSILHLVATAIATISIGFGINAIVRPDHGLTFFAFEPPADAALHRMVDSLMAIYGIRDIFMGLVIYATAYYGTRQALGWTLILNSAVAFADGAVCWTHGQGQWAHWGYAPLIAVVGSLILVDRA